MVPPSDDSPKFRYTAALANEIEGRWQDRWESEGTYHAPNPTGPLHDGWERVGDRPKLFVLDMFPYPSGTGLHVGHPLGYIGTDVLARFKRMTGFNVLHAMGYDAFGLPAEQYAVQTGQHPRVTTEDNIANMRRQFRAMGLGHDERRSVATTDVDYYRWTQWIFLRLFGSWYDSKERRARPIEELPVPGHLTGDERIAYVDDHRLAYIAEAPVNWCPALGTVLANEEVTSDGRSERGNFPVYRRPLRQWMLRITAYADRLIEDLSLVDWPEAVRLMQRNWIGRSEGARVRFPVVGVDESIEVFTTRPDTLFGATFMVLAPEHPLVDVITTPEQRDAVDAYRLQAEQRSDLDRQTDAKVKTGVATGAVATNPTTGAPIPVWIADYVLMGYGTGAIMAVPGQDQRDWDFAEQFDLPVIRTVQPTDDWDGKAFTGDGPAVNSGFLDGMGIAAAKRSMIEWLEAEGHGEGTVTYKLRDWLFSRQRYWGEPFPIVYDDAGNPHAVPDELLPVELPEIEDYAPEVRADDDRSVPEPPLGRVEDWKFVSLDLGDGPRTYRRELNTMPQWAGSCWYYLRYLDPTNDEAFVDPEIEHYWMQGSNPDGTPKAGGVDLYVGGVEHAVLHLLYSRFWHKVLYDLGHVSTPEPFHRLFNQGMVLAAAYTDERGVHVDATAIEGDDDTGYTYEGRPVTREMGKMGKSLKNSVSPDEIYEGYGADTLRLYEMSTGPLDAERPWNTRDIVGVYRFLQRLWRHLIDEDSGELTVVDAPAPDDLRRLLHKTIAGVRDDMEAMRFNTAVAKLIELNNALGPVVRDVGGAPREVAEGLVLMLAPLAPHVAEELWARFGHRESLVWADFPEADASLLVEDEIEIPVQIQGKVRSRIKVAADADAATIEAAALADPDVIAAIDGREVKRVIVVPGRMVNIVI
ncbi:MAG: leucyl-tRNA synthetase [Actinomycetia bacterium]|nr:leucyl-tRNA synthetase [Actinomycetes bacterium]